MKAPHYLVVGASSEQELEFIEKFVAHCRTKGYRTELVSIPHFVGYPCIAKVSSDLSFGDVEFYLTAYIDRHSDSVFNRFDVGLEAVVDIRNNRIESKSREQPNLNDRFLGMDDLLLKLSSVCVREEESIWCKIRRLVRQFFGSP